MTRTTLADLNHLLLANENEHIEFKNASNVRSFEGLGQYSCGINSLV